MPKLNRKTVWKTFKVLALFFSVVVFFAGPIRTSQTIGDELDLEVKAVFESKCVMCHDTLGEDAAGGDVNFLLKFEKLIEDGGYIDRDAPDDSYLLALVPDDMPKPKMKKIEWNGPLSDEQVETVHRWVKRGGPSKSYLQTQTEVRKRISFEDVQAAIVADFQTLHGAELANARYLSISHLFSNPEIDSKQLELYRSGITKVLNSLSWQPAVVIPIAIDEARTVFRFDLRKLGWDAATWENIARHNPYGIVQHDATATALYNSTSSQTPHLRADWFVFAATQPPLYHQILSIPKLQSKLEDRLFGRTDARLENIRNAMVARAGFGDSGVSVNNRLVERHSIATGSYWVSYDFGGNTGRQNLMNHPLGPIGISGESWDRHAFEHDGGEVIFSLPNGFQAYGLFDGTGNRIDVGPTNIVHDDSMTGGAIINGISCISCHDQGMKPENAKQLENLDRVRNVAADNVRRFDEQAQRRITELFPEGKEFSALAVDDQKRFLAAMGNAKLATSGPEPVRALFDQFITDLTVESAAAELYLSREEFENRMGREGETRQVLLRLKDEGVKRQLFLSDFATIVRLGLGKTHRPFELLPYPFFGEKVGLDAAGLSNATGVGLIDQDHFGGKLHITLKTTGEKKRFRENEVMQCQISATRTCFVSVFSVDPEGDLTMLVPNKWHPEGLKVHRGETKVFPTDEMGFEFYATPPHGRTLIKAIATQSPLQMAGVSKDRLAQEGIVGLGNTKSIRTKGMGVRPTTKHENAFDLSHDLPAEKFRANEWATSRFTIFTEE